MNVLFTAPVDWGLNGNNICFNAKILFAVSDFEVIPTE